MNESNFAPLHHVSRTVPFRPRFDIGVMRADCGREPVVESYDAAAQAISWPLVDYSQCPPTVDQEAINRWLQDADLDGKSILHIGAGNSSLARVVAGRASRVVGVTVAVNELLHGESLGLPGYSVSLLNKHGAPFVEVFDATVFDIVVDNNLTSFACCQKHFERYFASVVAMLAPDGVLLTHWLGMQWVLDVGIDDVETAWRLDAGKLETIAAAFGLNVSREGDLFFLRHAGSRDPS